MTFPPAHPTRRRVFTGIAAALALTPSAALTSTQHARRDPAVKGRILQVGPTRKIRTLAEAARLARDGDVLHLDAGDYRGEVASWAQQHLTIKAVGGRAHLWADGNSAQEKEIFVAKGGYLRLEGLAFRECTVPHRNGAGVRLEKGQLVVRDCLFLNNENGILTSANALGLDVERCEFRANGFGDGYSHGIYAGAIDTLRVVACHFHEGQIGHLIKSRARMNQVLYNSLVDGPTGTSSYELEFPNGGLAVVVGNVIQQSPRTDNPILVSFGAEGYGRWPRQELHMAHNTLVNDKGPEGRLLRMAPGAHRAAMFNNLLIGVPEGAPNAASLPIDAALTGQARGNVVAQRSWLAAPDQLNYRPMRNTQIGSVVALQDVVHGVPLSPAFEYQSPLSLRPLKSEATWPGALRPIA